MVYMVNMNLIKTPLLNCKTKERQLENCLDSKQAFIADSFHEKGLTLKFSIKIPFVLPYMYYRVYTYFI